MTTEVFQFRARGIEPQIDLTRRQLEVLTFIRDYRHTHGIAPTMKEIGDALGIKKVAVFEHLVELERKRAIRRDHGQSRSVEILRHDLIPPRERLRFPVLGTIARDGVMALTTSRIRSNRR